MPSESFQTLEDAYKLVPDDVLLHIKDKLSHELTKKQIRLLLYLIACHEAGTLMRESTETIIRNFYELHELAKLAQGDDGDDGDDIVPPVKTWQKKIWGNHPGRGMVRNLRSELLAYHKSGQKSDISISIGEKNEQLVVNIFRPLKASPDSNQPELVACYDLGNDHQALRYEIGQMPALWRLRDTHVRPEHGTRTYDKELLDEYKQGLKEFLSRASENQIVMVVGQTVDDGYVKSIVGAAEGQESKVVCHRIHQDSLMNFALLDYVGDRDSEVLFGWGRHGSKNMESVFRSSDSRLVNEFEEYYDALIKSRSSEKLSNVNDLTEPSKDTHESATITQWSQDRIYDLLRSAKQGAEVRILTTMFIDWTIMLPRVKELLKKGVNLKIVMMDPESALVQARFKRREDYPPLKAQTEIEDQLIAFGKINDGKRFTGKLEVRKSEIMPFGFYVQSGRDIVMGLMPPLSTYHEGPMISVKADSSLGKELEKNWLGYWEIRSVAELTEIEKQDVKQIWLYTPDLSNDTSDAEGKRVQLKELVKENAERGVRYTVIYPKQKITKDQLEEFRELFPLNKANRRPNIREISLKDPEFLRLIPDLQLTLDQKPPHVVIYNPERENGKSADLYMEIEGTKFLWRRLEGDEAKITLDRFTKLVKKRRA